MWIFWAMGLAQGFALGLLPWMWSRANDERTPGANAPV